MTENEERLASALRPFGWTCTETFWKRYYSDPWVFALANAVEQLQDRIRQLQPHTLPPATERRRNIRSLQTQAKPVICRCGDWAGSNGLCGPNGCYNSPA